MAEPSEIVIVVEQHAPAVVDIQVQQIPPLIQVEVPGQQGPKGDKGDIGYQIFVSPTPPENPSEGTLWLDIS
jgi:hypothetical protein